MTACYQQNYRIRGQKSLVTSLCRGESEDIYDTVPENGANDDYATAVRKLCEYFKPQCQVNTEYEAFKFHKCEQMADETIDAYCTRLRELAASCKFMTWTEK